VVTVENCDTGRWGQLDSDPGDSKAQNATQVNLVGGRAWHLGTYLECVEDESAKDFSARNTNSILVRLRPLSVALH
jgi:hypothetical protein